MARFFESEPWFDWQIVLLWSLTQQAGGSRRLVLEIKILVARFFAWF